jgi:prepilin-type N-terminal cleavage/methylation domain-containing protein
LVYILLPLQRNHRCTVKGTMKRTKGLTMVELVIAMAILAILTVAMMPNLGSWLSHNRIKGLARDVASCFRLAQMTAVQTNQTCCVRFDTANGVVRVLDGGGASLRNLTVTEYRTRFDGAMGTQVNGFDFVDQGGDGLISVFYNSRGIPSDEQGSPLTPPGAQNGQRVFFENSRGEGYWVEVTPVGNVRFDRYKS